MQAKKIPSGGKTGGEAPKDLGALAGGQADEELSDDAGADAAAAGVDQGDWPAGGLDWDAACQLVGALMWKGGKGAKGEGKGKGFMGRCHRCGTIGHKAAECPDAMQTNMVQEEEEAK